MDWLNSIGGHADEAAINLTDAAPTVFVTVDVGDGEIPFQAIRTLLLFLDKMGKESAVHLAEHYVLLRDLIG